MLLKFIHVIVPVNAPVPFHRRIIFLCKGRSHFVYLFITLGTFGFLPVIGYCDNVVMKICVQGFAFVLYISTQIFFILLTHLGVEFLGHMIAYV